MNIETLERVTFMREWVRINRESILQIYPDLDETEVDELLYTIALENIEVPDIRLTNDYRGKQIEIDMLTFLEWLEKTKPIIAGFGTLYRSQKEIMSPSSIMLDKFLALRDSIKANLRLVEVGSREYQDYDNDQGNEKVNANSFYGSSGAPTSRFFNLTVAASTTLTGQTLVSTPAQAFEMFLSNSVKFYNINNFIDYITHILELPEYKVDMSQMRKPTVEEVIERFVNMFYNTTEADELTVREFIHSLSDDQLKRVYYKNNIYEAFEQEPLRSLLIDALDGPEELSFLDPNDPPEGTKEILEHMWDYVYEICYVPGYIPLGRTQRLRYHNGRESTVYVDTDSNMVTVRKWVDFCMNKIADQTERFKDREYDDAYIITINTISFLLTSSNTKLFQVYGERANIPPEYSSRIIMKNEYLFQKMLLGLKKKRYITTVLLREGDYFDKPLLDIKGFDFIKSSTSKDVEKRFIQIIKENITEPETMDPVGAMNDLAKFEEEIRESILLREKKYLLPHKAKAPEAYKYPLREGVVRGVMAWNSAYPEQQIANEEHVDLVPVDLSTVEEASPLKDTVPEIYERLVKDIYESSNSEVRKKGINVIAVPRNVEKTPEWIIPFIQTDSLVNKTVSKFNAVLEALGVSVVTMDQTTFYSNIKLLG